MSEVTPILAGERPEYSSIDKELVSTKQEFTYILSASFPLIVAFLLQFLLPVTSIFACGKLGSTELAACSLAICTFNITGLSVYQGMATSLDSLCSQAFGQNKPHNVGLYFQRCSLMMLTVTVFPLSFIWWYSGAILTFLVKDGELALMCQDFLRVSILAAPALVFMETGKRFLQAQHLYNVSLYILLIACPFNIILNWVLVWHLTLGLGFIGASWSIVITFWFICLVMLLYVCFIDGKQCWGGFEPRNAFSNWIPILQLAVPGVVMVMAEYLAFEVLTILAAYFGTDALAAQSISSTVGSLSFQLPFAVSVAFLTRIGHFVGLRNVHAAITVVRLSIIFAAIVGIFNFSLIILGRSIFSSIFTDSDPVKNISNHILILVGINQLSDSVNVLAAGVLRGQGRQRIGSILNLTAYYLVALPIGYILAFVFGWEIYGLWCGLLIGVFFLASSQVILICKSNWNDILIEALERHA